MHFVENHQKIYWYTELMKFYMNSAHRTYIHDTYMYACVWDYTRNCLTD
jgi:hypothetical protein